MAPISGRKLHPGSGQGDKGFEKRRDVLDVVTIGCLSPSEETPTLIDNGGSQNARFGRKWRNAKGYGARRAVQMGFLTKVEIIYNSCDVNGQLVGKVHQRRALISLHRLVDI